MTAYETTATIETGGELRLSDVPFEPGTQVEVFVTPKRATAEEFVARWQQVCQALRGELAGQEITDEEIQAEIDAYRAGR